MAKEKKTFRGHSEEQTGKQGVSQRVVEPVERFPLGRLISDNWWSFLDGYQRYHYVVWLKPEDILKYTEVDENGNVIRKPTVEDIEYNIYV